MKKIFIIILLSITYLACYAKKNPEIYLMYSTFDSPNGQYIETYMSIIGESLNFIKTDKDTYQAEIEIVLLLKKADSIVDLDKYILKSPEVRDSLSSKPNFIDVQRLYVPNGIYNFEVHIKDINSDNAASIYNDIIHVNFPEYNLSFSGLQFVESITATTEESILSKNGYDMIPYVSVFFPTNTEKLSFYVEIYNTDKIINDDFVLRYYIENYESSNEIEKYSRFKRMSSASILPFIGEINIKDLTSGNYNLVIEIRNKDNKSLKTSKHFFQRSNANNDNKKEILEMARKLDIYTTFSGDMSSRDSLISYISCLRPIGDVNEIRFIDFQMKESSIDVLQNFFIQFWVSRNSINPNDLWKEYKTQVNFVNKLYKTPIRMGYETDMGVVYLKYGAPNNIYTSKHEPSAYPYEIWTYWRTELENNRKFVFYNPDMVGKEFELLHSNARGEINTPNWERYLQKRNQPMYNFDDLNSDESWGSRALEEFNK